MRELKFRAWANGYKKYCEYVDYADGVWIGYVKTPKGLLSTTDVIVEQSTGFEDKNGKEIYEGDILEYDWYIIGNKPAYRVKEQVVFDDMGARVGDDRIRNCSNVEVVGNVHENKELLGGKE